MLLGVGEDVIEFSLGLGSVILLFHNFLEFLDMGYMLFESLLALVNVSIYLVNGLLNFLDLFQLPLHQLWIPSLRHLFFLIIESIIFEYLFFLMLFNTLLTILFQLLFFFSFLNRSLLASIFNSFLLS